MSLLEVSHLQKIYTSLIGGKNVQALKDVTFSVEPGEFVAIMGESGAGKSTLLNLLAGLDSPSSGSITLNGENLASVKEERLADYRRNNLGFVFQEVNLLDTFNVQDNILLPLVLNGEALSQMLPKLKDVSASLGIADLLKQYPYQISGGQKQRAAVARAIITKPSLLLADEPTGALDSASSDALLRLFRELNEKEQTILMVTHSVKAASFANRVLFIKDGKLFHQLYRGSDTDGEFYERIANTLTLLSRSGYEKG